MNSSIPHLAVGAIPVGGAPIASTVSQATGIATRTIARAAESAKDIRADKAAKEFESIFVSMMIKEMRQTQSGEGLFPGDNSDTFGGMFDMLMGQQIAEGGGIGLAYFLKKTANGLGGTPAYELDRTNQRAALNAYRSTIRESVATPPM